jgi:hypothetical protein
MDSAPIACATERKLRIEDAMTASTTNIEARRQSERRHAALAWVARQLEWEQVLNDLRARRDAGSARKAA